MFELEKRCVKGNMKLTLISISIEYEKWQLHPCYAALSSWGSPAVVMTLSPIPSMLLGWNIPPFLLNAPPELGACPCLLNVILTLITQLTRPRNLDSGQLSLHEVLTHTPCHDALFLQSSGKFYDFIRSIPPSQLTFYSDNPKLCCVPTTQQIRSKPCSARRRKKYWEYFPFFSDCGMKLQVLHRWLFT